MTILARGGAPPQETEPGARLAQCLSLIRAGQCAEARLLLSGLTDDAPLLAAARGKLALTLKDQGDLDGAERELRAAVRLDRRDHGLLTALGEILIAKGVWGEAECVLRGALALHRSSAPATVALTRLLLARKRPAEALQVTTSLALRADASPVILDAQAAALRALGATEDARVVAERARAAAGR